MSAVITEAKAVATATRTKKATRVVVEQVKDLTNIRAEVKTLEGQAKKIVEALEAEFGKDDKAKVSEFDTLIHNGIEVARMDWRSRPNFSASKFTEAFSESVAEAYPDLAEALAVLIAEAMDKATSETRYTVLNTLYK
jgi:hypothetical protein